MGTNVETAETVMRRDTFKDQNEEEQEEAEDETPPKVPTNLSEWNCDHIRIWLNSVSKMFNIEKMPSVQKFPRTGKELRQLSRRQFQRITGDSYLASILSRHLAFLEGKPNEPLEMSEDEDDETGSEINVKVTSSQTKTPPNIVEINESNYTQFLPSSTSSRDASSPSSGACGQPQLWQFLLELLANPNEYSDYICWENPRGNGDFRLIDPEEIAKFGVSEKTKQNMNYDKLS